MAQVDPDTFTYRVQLTPTYHRSDYPYLDPSRPELSAADKTVLITGAAGGVGEFVVKGWAQANAKAIIITSRNKASLEETAAKIQTIYPKANIIVLPSDIRSESSIKELFASIKAQVGTLDVVVNTVGSLTPGNVGAIDTANWWADHETNVKGFYILATEYLKVSDGKGTLITVGTGATSLATPGMGAYITSKLAQQKLVEVIQAENPGMRVFNVLPGIPLTKMTQPAFQPFAKDDPMLTAGMSLWLATPAADWLGGSSLSVNWDIEEMESHKEAILEGRLAQLGFLNAKLQKGGHPF